MIFSYCHCLYVCISVPHFLNHVFLFSVMSVHWSVGFCQISMSSHVMSLPEAFGLDDDDDDDDDDGIKRLLFLFLPGFYALRIMKNVKLDIESKILIGLKSQMTLN